MDYFLDTNVMIAYLREPNSIQEYADKYFNPLSVLNNPIISVVTVGEIKSIAIKNGWGAQRVSRMEDLLNKVTVADINSEDVINRYAEIDAFSQCRLDGRVSNFTARNMGKNDLWIAATASILDATLLTTDNDFEHLQEEFLQVAKIDLTN